MAIIFMAYLVFQDHWIFNFLNDVCYIWIKNGRELNGMEFMCVPLSIKS